jgi:hypothetical protein
MSYLVGAWLLKQLNRSSEVSRYWAVVLGVVLFVVVSAVPLLGGLVGLATLLLGLGALWFWLRGGVAPTTVATPMQAARTAPMPMG